VFRTVADRTYRVRRLARNFSPDALRLNLVAKRCDGEAAGVHIGTLDLYVARVRGLFIVQAAQELGVSEETIKRDVGAVILALESLVTQQIAATLAPATTPGGRAHEQLAKSLSRTLNPLGAAGTKPPDRGVPRLGSYRVPTITLGLKIRS
jgi:hypothetical protein